MIMRANFDAAAKRIFDSFGNLIEEVTYAVPGTWNPVTETQTPASSETIRVKVAPFSKMETDGTNVMVGDLEAVIIVSELTASPKIDDKLTWDGVDYLVRNVTNVHKVIYRLHLRRV